MRAVLAACLAARLAPGFAGSAGAQLDISEMPPLIPRLSFTNPFRQYEGGLIPGWEYGGEATLSNDYIMLTSASTNKLGWVWASEPVSLSSWEAELVFHVGGDPRQSHGGGMAFWLTEQQGRGGPIYGHSEDFKGLGIFFDTRSSAEGTKIEPFVVAILHGGTTTAPVDEQVGLCYAAYRNLKNIVHTRIAFVRGQLRIWLDLTNSGHWQPCIETVNLIDLARTDPRYRLPDTAYFGITGVTGARADTHVVYSLGIADLSASSEDADPLEPVASSSAEVDLDLRIHMGGEDEEHPEKIELATDSLPTERAPVVEMMADAPNQAPHATTIPPTTSEEEYLSRFAHELFGVEEALWELNSHSNHSMQQMGEVVASLKSVAAQGAALEQHVLRLQASVDTLKAAAALNPIDNAPPTIQSPDLPPRGEALLERISASAKALDAMGHSHSTDIRDVKALMESIHASSGSIEARLRNVDNTVSALAGNVQQLQGALYDLSAKSKDDRHGSVASGLLAMGVCGQMLVLAVFLFYKSSSNKRHLL